MTDRRYDDPCGIARALNLIGERWALLVVRELLFGPRRFTDLKAGLPTASQNVLTHRLRELRESGIVTRHQVGAPVYELTRRGYELKPVVLELARWGCHLPTASTMDLSVPAVIFALLTTFSPDQAGDLRATYQLRIDDEAFRATIAAGTVDISPGLHDKPDATIEAGRATLRSLVFGGANLSEAIDAGNARVDGSADAVAKFLAVFPRPAITSL
ncbi:MAG: winged helix-turn-helix transcriptional regulator [Kibdelosporangium sp.]